MTMLKHVSGAHLLTLLTHFRTPAVVRGPRPPPQKVTADTPNVYSHSCTCAVKCTKNKKNTIARTKNMFKIHQVHWDEGQSYWIKAPGLSPLGAKLPSSGCEEEKIPSDHVRVVIADDFSISSIKTTHFYNECSLITLKNIDTNLIYFVPFQ